MTALSIRNMNKTVGERELETGIPLTTLEKLQAKLEVAQSLQKQTGWNNIVSKGWELEGEVFVALVDFANADPQHVLNAEQEPNWDEIVTVTNSELGARFIVSGGEVMELDSHLESAYDERNGDIELDMPF